MSRWKCRGSWGRFNCGLGVEGLKRGLGKCRWAGFGVVNFIRGLLIWVFKLGNSMVYSDNWISIWIHVGWSVNMTWFRIGESKKWYDRDVVSKIGQVGNWAMEWSNFAAHRGLKRWLFWDPKLVVCGCSIICSYVSSILDCWVIICWIGLCG